MRFDGVDDVLKVRSAAFCVAQQLFHFCCGVICFLIVGDVNIQFPESRCAPIREPFLNSGFFVNRLHLFTNSLYRSCITLDFNCSSYELTLRLNIGGRIVPFDFEIDCHLIQHSLATVIHIRERHARCQIFQHPALKFPVYCRQHLCPRLFSNDPRQSICNSRVLQLNHPRHLRR